ncbi:odorant receptor 10-like isoform X2 [Prorops nasuta]|uniref:odorant receptor 10-like isoform X2 n=1 Tax=Prorops nasuta TaxID=863751 RepID=UPI0034CF45DF
MDGHKLLRFLKILGSLTSTWPPDSSSSRFHLIVRNVCWFLSLVNVVGLLIPLVLAAYVFRRDVTAMMKALSELTALTEVFLNLIICKVQWPRFEALFKKVNSYFTNAKPSEEAIIQKYVDRYSSFSIFVALSYVMSAITFSSGPLVLKIYLPAETWYPFSIEDRRTRTILYTQQVLAILQTGFCIVVDFFIALLLWFPAARLELLGKELQNAQNRQDIQHCVKIHQEVIEFVQDTQTSVHNLLLKTNVTMAAAVVFGTFPLIYHSPLPVVSQFLCFVIGGCLRLYITAWPADDLKEMSEKISWHAYCIPWMDKRQDIKRSVSVIIQRSQKPLAITMSAILPVLSLRYYSTFLYTTMSYFMTMRAIIDIH